ncbi:MAG TPA: T9SS type A sorting domain-containing protein [Bacteroidales bacterium]|nr:T9SS type A sorting domain-containing protein [Bacteroidales bacterium]
MKKFYVVFAFLLTSGIAFSQIAPDKAVITKKLPALSTHSVKTPTDTAGFSDNFFPLYDPNGDGSSFYSYADDDWADGCGFVFGNNYDGYNIVAQGYTYDYYMGIEGTLLLFGGKTQNNAGAVITVSAHPLTGTATNGTGEPQTSGPGAAVATATLTMADVDTTWPNFTWVPFTSVVPMNGSFAVSVDFDALNGVWDTLATPTLQSGDEAGLVCDKTGSANNADLALMKVGATWYVVDYGYGGLDVTIGIFPVVDINYVGINDDHYFYGMQSNAYPIPATNNMTIEYALENSADVAIEIIASNGQTIAEFNQGNQTQGQYSFQVNVSDFNAGHYFYSIKANGQRLIKSFIVE